MDEDIKKIQELISSGSCCASTIVQMGLELKGEKNEQMVQAVRGLCGGVQSRLLCGVLTGAACMLNVVDPENANSDMVPELVAWFEEKYGKEFGGIDCKDIIGGGTGNRIHCPRIIEETYLQAKKILESYGHSFEL